MYFIDSPRGIVMVTDSEKEADEKIKAYNEAWQGTLSKREHKPKPERKHSTKTRAA